MLWRGHTLKTASLLITFMSLLQSFLCQELIKSEHNLIYCIQLQTYVKYKFFQVFTICSVKVNQWPQQPVIAPVFIYWLLLAYTPNELFRLSSQKASFLIFTSPLIYSPAVILNISDLFWYIQTMTLYWCTSLLN